jgi:hypothetical protein
MRAARVGPKSTISWPPWSRQRFASTFPDNSLPSGLLLNIYYMKRATFKHREQHVILRGGR